MGAVALRRRSDRRIAAMLTALVILSAAGLSIWAAAVLAFTDTELPALDDALAQTWDSPWVIAVGGLLGLFGLILVVLALKPGPAWFADLRGEDAHGSDPASGPTRALRTVVTTQGLRRLAAAETERVDGVFDPKVRVRGHRLTITASTLSPDTAATSEAVEEAVRRRLEEMGPRRTPKVVARLRRRKDS